jgi:hypothetical protein
MTAPPLGTLVPNTGRDMTVALCTCMGSGKISIGSDELEGVFQPSIDSDVDSAGVLTGGRGGEYLRFNGSMLHTSAVSSFISASTRNARVVELGCK